MYSRLREKWAVCTPAVVTEPRYRSRHVSGVCCRDKSGMPESRALLLCAFTSGSAPESAGIFHRTLQPPFLRTPVTRARPFYYDDNHNKTYCCFLNKKIVKLWNFSLEV